MQVHNCVKSALGKEKKKPSRPPTRENIGRSEFKAEHSNHYLMHSLKCPYLYVTVYIVLCTTLVHPVSSGYFGNFRNGPRWFRSLRMVPKIYPAVHFS